MSTPALAQQLINRAWRRRIEQRAFADQRAALEAWEDHEAHDMATGRYRPREDYKWLAEQLGLTQIMEEQECQD